MSDTFTNETGCEVSRSHMTGDIVCQRPGPDCDCLIVAADAPRVDMDAHYTVDGFHPGIAFYLLGHVERDTPDTYWDGIREVDRDWVRAVMIGDDRVHEIEVCDLNVIPEDGFCRECGQTGCGHAVYV